MPDEKGRKVLKVGEPQPSIDDVLNALYVSLYHNKCGLRMDALGNPVLFMIESGEVLGEFFGVAPRTLITGNRKLKKALDEMQYLMERYGYRFMRGNHYGRIFLLLQRNSDRGWLSVAEVGQIIPDRGSKRDGIDWRTVGGDAAKVVVQ